MSESPPTSRSIAIEQLQFAQREPHVSLSDYLAIAQTHALIYIGDAINDLVSQGDAR